MNQILMDFVGKYKSQIDQDIAEELEKRLTEVREISPHLIPILQAMKELSVGGKRLRAMLVILGYQIASEKGEDKSEMDEDQIIKAGVVMELFHLGLLIQDDFMDRDMTRRSVPTLIARYDDKHIGDFVSMLAGDYTFGWGMELITNLKFSNALPADATHQALQAGQIVGAMQVWGKYFTRVGYGQTLDGLDIADDEIILKILAIKSGEYSCVLPLLLGATLGGADKGILEMLEQYGMAIGWVFQLRDDYIGYDKDMAKVGKKTYATMYGKDKTVEAISEYMGKARMLLSGFASLPGDSRKVMEELVTWLGTRDN